MSEWEGTRLLVTVAHPDDETFGLGSLIADAAARGATVVVCCATRGEAGELTEGCDLGGRSLADVRVEELHDAGHALGAARIVMLDFGDSGMRGDVGPDTLVGAPLESVVQAVGRVIDDVQPQVIVTLDADGSDGHRDHTRIGEATIEAARRRAPAASLYSWCLPRALLQRWFDEQRAALSDREHLELETSSLGRAEADITTVIDEAAHLALRRKAIALHRSQRSPFEGMSAAFADAFLREDHLVRIAPPWEGGPVETELHVPR